MCVLAVSYAAITLLQENFRAISLKKSGTFARCRRGCELTESGIHVALSPFVSRRVQLAIFNFTGASHPLCDATSEAQEAHLCAFAVSIVCNETIEKSFLDGVYFCSVPTF